METQHRYLSGKAAKEILQVSDNTLRRWANEGKIDYIRNTARGKRFYDISSIINEQKKINHNTVLANTAKQLSKTDSYTDLCKKGSNVLLKQYNIIDKPLKSIKCASDDTCIDYAYSTKESEQNYKKPVIQSSNVYCYCKVNKKTQQPKLEEQIEKLKQLYHNPEIISCVATNDLNWKKNNILILINKLKEKKIKELIINKSEFISNSLIELITELCLMYDIKVINI